MDRKHQKKNLGKKGWYNFFFIIPDISSIIRANHCETITFFPDIIIYTREVVVNNFSPFSSLLLLYDNDENGVEKENK